MDIRQSKPSEFLEAQKFYDKFKYEWIINPDDYILIAKEKDEVIGIVRINEEYGYPVLRGLYVDEPHRGQGIATKLLTRLEQHLQGEESYCIPYVRLKGFYKQFGYEAMAFDKAPVFLKKMLQFNNKPKRYSIKRERRIIMRKLKSG